METNATILYARMRPATAISRALDPLRAAEFVVETRRALSESVAKQGGLIAQMRHDAVLAVFANEPDAKPDHARRALHAAVIAVYESVRLGERLASGEFGGQSAGAALSLSVGAHLGKIEASPGGRGSSGQIRVTGEAVEIARVLEATAADLRWSIVASRDTRRAAAERVESGRIGSVGLPGAVFVDVVEITGLAPLRTSTTPPEVFAMLRDSVALNQRLLEKPQDIVAAAGNPSRLAASHFSIEGYQIVRKIGEGGMALIYLAQPVGTDELQVLKVIRLGGKDGDDGLQRFMQEFALLAQVQHPNVAKIFRQEFSAGHAFLAMEYFSMGDLRARMAQGIAGEDAIEYLKAAAAGLAAIHAAGIVHRDLKPDNLMLRKDGSLALADFGIAKHVSMLLTETAHGDVIGTPYYLSPEQATGRPVDARSDLYSLGVIMFELLTGSRPYRANTAEALLDMHVNAPVPTLPEPYELLQPMLDGLMAKERDLRYPSAQKFLDDLLAMGF